MIKPLCLVPSNEQARSQINDITSPVARKRADSLVFSITSQKFFSPKESMLIESKQNEVSRELETLQLKLQNLQSRVQRIDSQHPSMDNIFVPQEHKRYETNVCLQTRKNLLEMSQENKCCNTTKVGKIVKKDRDLAKTTKFQTMGKNKPRVNAFVAATQSRHSMLTEDSQLIGKIKELSQLKKEVSAMKHSMQKNKRSKSICSERLSASKDMIRSLKKDEKKMHKVVDKLKNDLKKSQNIREKQKQVIKKQQEQLNYYRELFKMHKKLR